MKYILLSIYCYIIFCMTSGQINGDPAPGRSPGPPNFNASANNVIPSDLLSRVHVDSEASSTISYKSNKNGQNSNDTIEPFIENYDKFTSDKSQTNEHKLQESVTTNGVTVTPENIQLLSGLEAIASGVLPPPLPPSSEQSTQSAIVASATTSVKPKTTNTQTVSKFNNQMKSSGSYSFDPFHGNGGGGGGGGRTGTSTNGGSYSGTTSNKACIGISDYITSDEKIVRRGETSDENDNMDDSPNVKLDVRHGVFDARKGLINNVIYTVELLIDGQPGIVRDFFIESYGINDDGNVNSEENRHAIGKFIDPVEVAAVKTFQLQQSYNIPNKWNNKNSDITSSGEESRKIKEIPSYPRDNLPQKMTANELRWQKNRNDFNTARIPGYNEVFDDGSENSEKTQWIKCTQNVWSERLQHNTQNRTMKWILSEPNIKEKTVKFRLLYRKNTNAAVFENIYTHQLLEDCSLYLMHPVGNLDYTAMPLYTYDNCTVFFPSRDIVSAEPAGLLVHLTRLNVPCINGGYISVGNAAFLCGKLEDLTLSERTYYFASHRDTNVRLHKYPLFSFNYELVDYCYNTTLTHQNSSYFLQPKTSLECNFKIHLPYGNRIELKLVTNLLNNTETYSDFEYSETFVEPEFVDLNLPQTDVASKSKHCYGLFVRIEDTDTSKYWTDCINAYSPTKNFNIISTGNILILRVSKILYSSSSTSSSSSSSSSLSPKSSSSLSSISSTSSFSLTHSSQLPPQPSLGVSTLVQGPSLLFEYVALPITQLVSQCAFGWVAAHQFCITSVDEAATWHHAEMECRKRGGHLASVRSEREQRIIDYLLLNSSSYKDNAAYWIGASDEHFEGDFRWSTGYPFSYANWFPGWPEHNNYNKQPNDDGLSGQDCVELRRFFQRPPGNKIKNQISLTPTYMWNDRDCNARNYFLCERPMSDEPVDATESATGCNKTIFLTRDRPRASLWSPGFPRHYPDNVNCFTVVIAPVGFSIVLEFEELILENEPECSYDYLEIIDVKEEETLNRYPLRDLYRKYLHRSNRSINKRQYSYNNYNEVYPAAQYNTVNSSDAFQKFLNFYKSHLSVVLHTPKINVNSDKFFAAKGMPHRICGDWSSKLKLLRYVSQGPLMGLHFSSDYSHHFSGYKAKVTMKNASSECSDERLKPYNGTCYLFASYPEVDWQTAQQVCRGIGAQLASVSSADEQRFVVTNIRDQLDYSPQLIYWLGGELSENKEFEWTDGSKMSFQGWLPGQEIIDNPQNESVCLGLQWKKPATPMLPPGLYWTSKKCTKYGGYICKNKKQKIGDNFIQNKTITGTEGRITSPGYPNTYPLNLDYWIKLIGPSRTRLIIQFQIIDLEQQDECLYDYISIQDGLSNPLDIDPGLNILPMAMFASSEIDYPNDSEDISDDFLNAHSKMTEFHEEYRKMEEDLHKASMTKRDIKYFRDLHGTLRAEDALQDKIRLLEKLHGRIDNRIKKTVTKRKKRFTSEDEAEEEEESLNSFSKKDDNPTFLPYVRWCGSHNANMSKFDFVSSANSAVLHFHSDYSLSGIGFSFNWNAIDISGCPRQILTATEGLFSSPNYPHFLLNNLDCSFIIQASHGKRIWLEFQDFETLEDSLVDLDLGNGIIVVPFRDKRHINEGVFLSSAEKVIVRVRTGPAPVGKGFQISYKTLNHIERHHVWHVTNVSHGALYHLNYPQDLPVNIDFSQRFVAPLGQVILLEIYGVGLTQSRCQDGNSLEVFDAYADKNGTLWHLCSIPNTNDPNLDYEQNQDDSNFQSSPIQITSYLNSLHVRQFSGTTINSRLRLNATLRTQQDINYKFKLASNDDDVESCNPDPCLFGGKCVSNGQIKRCQCDGHFTGRFCALNMCEVEPCLFGKCELTETSFKCRCHQGYIGKMCDQKQKPCAEKPCEGRGECFDRGGTFFCRCFAWWEGERCERRMVHIPYKPLSERMLQEPFWLGLITVFVVLAVIGLVWCAKRHFPEKIEKLLAEEAERNRPPGQFHGHHHHHPSLREQLQFTNSIPQSTATTPGAPRTIFGRLGIRKPSILSLSSPQPGGATARTFSLDDLLRPPPRRTPSPRKKRNNSTPTKKNAAEKKQILQQLITPANVQTRPRMHLDDLIHMSENRLKPCVIDSESDIKETTFSENSASASTSNKAQFDRFEKKVTFARLLSRVSAEMSSGSEVDVENTKQHESNLSLPVEVPLRASSVPPSPSTNEIRSPHSTSSNQGSGSLSSFDLMLPESELRFSKRMRPKVSSADSILAMFRNFASTTVSSQIPSPMIVSPSSTPSASSPQDDIPGDDESSTSSMYTPMSFTSGPSDSPVFYRQNTIEVPVLDLLNGQTVSASTSGYSAPPTILLEIPSNVNKCLSPIREMPTPMPSPALTPIMCRPQRFTKFVHSRHDDVANYSDDDENLSIEQYDNRIKGPIINIECDSPQDTDTPTDTGLPNRNTKPSLLQVHLPPPSISIDIQPPTPEERSSNRPTQLIIPQVTVQQASPTKERLPIMYPGSPPPQRQSVGETNFFAPTKQQRRQLKQYEKPASLDLPFIPPMITVTANMSEVESDADMLSPPTGKPVTGHLLVPSSGMCYLSPFSICTRGDRTISESNLSSSGYSSMASPGPSRCGSSNPLCSSEMEDPGTGASGSHLQLHSALSIRRHGHHMKNHQKESSAAQSENPTTEHRQRTRSRSDSETLSDDVPLESNDEGIGTDHLDEKIEDGVIKSAKELEIYLGKELVDSGKSLLLTEEPIVMSQLQLPLIVIQGDGNEKGLSPVSSRSESPLSERTTSMGRFSPLFYGKKDQQLPFTDSDGLYDFPSSDGKSYTSTHHHKKSSTKRRDRKSSRSGISQSPTKSGCQLEIPSKETYSSKTGYHSSKHHHSPVTTARKSPKRRPVQRHPVPSSSSSSDSIVSARELAQRSPRGMYLMQLPSNPDRGSDVDTEEDVSSQILPKTDSNDHGWHTKKTSRLRAIGNQIRFLRRLEKSIKKRNERDINSPTDSCHEDGSDVHDSPGVTSPLLKSPKSSAIYKNNRQKRLANIYGSNLAWRPRDRVTMPGDINSD